MEGTGHIQEVVNINSNTRAKYEIEYSKGIVHDIDPRKFLMMSGRRKYSGNFRGT